MVLNFLTLYLPENNLDYLHRPFGYLFSSYRRLRDAQVHEWSRRRKGGILRCWLVEKSRSLKELER